MPTRGLAVVAAVLSLAGIAPTARSAVDVPTLTLSKETVKPGEWVAVSGSGFPVGARLQIEVCGVGGSSNSCAISDAAFATTDAFGGFHQNLRVTEPPTPCPCVVHAAPYAGTLTFGNLSGGPADDPGVALTLSHGGKQIARHPVTWSGGSLPVGQRRTLYKLPLPGGWFRDYEVGVVIVTGGAGAAVSAPAGKPVTVRTLSASVRPRGELVAPGTLALGVLCLFAGSRRRHRPAGGLPVGDDAVAGRRAGAAVPEPFSTIDRATLGIVVAGIVVAPELEHAAAEVLETSENAG